MDLCEARIMCIDHVLFFSPSHFYLNFSSYYIIFMCFANFFGIPVLI